MTNEDINSYTRESSNEAVDVLLRLLSKQKRLNVKQVLQTTTHE